MDITCEVRNAAEVWRIIPTLQNYEASSLGNIRRIGCKQRKLQKNKRNGYVYVMVRHNGANKNLRVHRLVALAFLPNPSELTCVNHKDGNKTNNCLNNLEWCSSSENEIHKVHTLGKKQNPPHKTKSVVCVETGVIYPSIKAAGAMCSINHRHIGEVANGKRKSAGGFKWRFC